MKKLLLCLLWVLPCWLIAQEQNSRNGYNFSSRGTIRALMVFAEAVNDPLDGNPSNGGALGDWQPGQMPSNIEDYMDATFTNAGAIHGYLTKYYYEASFGELIVLGDYYPHLIQIDFDAITEKHGVSQIASYLNNLPGADILTKKGYSINSNDFDKWTTSTSTSNPPRTNEGRPKINNSDNYLDLLVVFWRINSKFKPNRDGGEMIIINSPYNYYPIKNKTGLNAFAPICAADPAKKTLRHEFAHALLGNNNFHSGGAGAGVGTYLSNMGGYSLLSSSDRNFFAYNGWDRWRLGWKPTANNYYISARTTNNVEVDADLEYGQALSTNEFILRDFATYGDAIRIKLPYLNSLNELARGQYIWIENHQLHPDKIESQFESQYDRNIPKGIRINIQVGNEDLSSFLNSRTNHFSPYSSFGNYDFIYSITAPVTMTTSSQQANPLTGYHLLQHHAINYINPNIVSGKPDDYDKIYAREYILPQHLIFNENLLFDNYPIFGTQYDVFPVGKTMNISSNPSSAAVLTYHTRDRRSKNDDHSPYPYSETTYLRRDNRYVLLNGLSIEVLSQNNNGDIQVRIKWDDFDVDNDVRWCGPIVLNENVYLKPDKTITLDQGLTPTKPLNPIVFNNDEKVFADPTVFYCKNNSYFKLETRSVLDVKNNSSFVMESGSTLEINDGAKLIVKSGSTLCLKSGSNLTVSNSGKIEIQDGGYLCVEPGANINLQHFNSVINLLENAILGVNPATLTNFNCRSSVSSIVKTGLGSINRLDEDVYVQNETITANRYFSGKNIYVGRNVTTSKPQGDVLISNNAQVIFDATENIIFDAGFECTIGASFEVVK